MNSLITHNKVAVVSGAFGYVGLKVAERLSREGFRVAMLYNKTSQEKIEQGIKMLSGDGHRAYACSLSDEVSVAVTLESITKEMGEVFLCIHAAGLAPERKKLYATTTSELRAQIETNVVGSFNFLTKTAHLLKDNKDGLLIGITTIGVVRPEATKSLGAYIPAKYAVQGMLIMLHDELAPHNVNVYSIAPGFMREGMNSAIPEAFVEMVRTKSKTGNLAKAEDIAEAIIAVYKRKKEGTPPNDMTIAIAPEYL